MPRVFRPLLDELKQGIDRLEALPPMRRERLEREIAKKIVEMPLWKLQTIRDQSEPM